MKGFGEGRALRALAGGVSLFVMLQAPAYAEDSPATSSTDARASAPALGEIVVTAQKRSESLQKTAIAITALTGDRIDQGGLDQPQKLQFAVPSMTYGYADGFSHISLRGVGNDTTIAAESSVGTYQDGVYTGSQITAAVPSFDLQRIEVLRGPQGTLYGRNTTGGVINYISKDPSFQYGANGEVSYGNYNAVETNIGLTGPLVGDKIAFRGSFHFNDHDGYYRNIALNRNEYADRDIGGRLALLILPASNVSLILRGDYSHDTSSDAYALIDQSSLDGLTSQASPLGIFSQPASYFTAHPGLLSPADIAKLNGGSIASYYGLIQPGVTAPNVLGTESYANWNTTSFRTTSWGLSGTLKWDIGSVAVKSITAYRYGELVTQGDVGGQAYPVLDASPIYQKDKQFTQEFNISGKSFQNRLDWLVGAFAYSDHVNAAEGAYLPSYGQYLEANAELANPPGSHYAYNLNPAALTSLNNLPGVFPSVWQTVVNTGPGFPGDAAGPNFVAGSTIPSTAMIASAINQTSTSYAAFFQATYHVDSKLRVTGGFRYTIDHKDAERINHSNLGWDLAANGIYEAVQAGYLPASAYSEANIASAAGLCDTETSKTWRAPTGTIGVDYDAGAHVLTYVKASWGYKAGGMNNSSCNSVYNPEHLTDYEGGVKAVLADGQVLANLAMYYYDYKDIQFTTYIESGSEVLNAGTAKAFGVEFEYALRPRALRGWQLDGSASFEDSHYGTGCFGDSANLNGAAFLSTPIQACPATVVNPSTGQSVPIGPSASIKGNELIRAPKWKFNIGLQYSTEVADLGGLMARVDVAWSDTIYNDIFNGKAPDEAGRTQPAYWMLNAQVGWTSPDKRYSAMLFGNNLTNTIYFDETVAFNLPPTMVTVGGQLAAPRTYGIRLSAKFGPGAR
jgi:iron complex outermembrane recepter protein